MPDEEFRLARRLRELRERHWPGVCPNQGQLAAALGVSRQQVAQWESLRTPKIAPEPRLESYARLFAVTPVDASHLVLKPRETLTSEEASRYEQLLDELLTLRRTMFEPGRSRPLRAQPGWFWRFDDGLPITIIGSRQPNYVSDRIPEADRRHPDYTETLHHADADAEIELYGHLRAANPTTEVVRIIEDQAKNPLLSGHVVVIGGGAVNRWAQWFAGQMNIPVGLASEVVTGSDGVLSEDWGQRRFTVDPAEGAGPGEPDGYEPGPDGRRWRVYRPEFAGVVRVRNRQGVEVEAPKLHRDVALIARMDNPFRARATVSLFLGLFSRGTYGAVRAFTDPELLADNEAYLEKKTTAHPTSTRFWMLHRVLCDRSISVTGTVDLSKSLLLESFT